MKREYRSISLYYIYLTRLQINKKECLKVTNRHSIIQKNTQIRHFSLQKMLFRYVIHNLMINMINNTSK